MSCALIRDGCLRLSDRRLVSWRFSLGFYVVSWYLHFWLMLLQCLFANPSFPQESFLLWLSLLYVPWVESDTQHCRAVLAVFGTIDWVCWCAIVSCGKLPLFLGSIRKEMLLPTWVWTIAGYYEPISLFAWRFDSPFASFRLIFIGRCLKLSVLHFRTFLLVLIHFWVLFRRLWIWPIRFEGVASFGVVIGFGS